MDKNDFDIFIIGSQKYDENDDKIDVKTSGTYYIKDGKQIIEYLEYSDENPDKPTSVMLEINDETAIMSHKNSTTRLILEKNRRHLCVYDTPYGMIQLGVFTHFFKSTLGNNGGLINIKYTIDIDSQLSSKNEIKISVKRRH